MSEDESRAHRWRPPMGWDDAQAPGYLATVPRFLSDENTILEGFAAVMENRTADTERYAVTYAFDGHGAGSGPKPIERILETARSLTRDGLTIGFLGAVQVVDEAGRLRMVTARFEAPSQGVIGLLNCRGELPACGAPRRINTEPIDSDPVAAGVVVGAR